MVGAEASAAERGMVLNFDIGARCGGGFLDRALRLLGAVLAAVTCGVLLDLRVDEVTSSSKPPVKSSAASLLATAAFNQYCCCSVLLANRSSCGISSRHWAASSGSSPSVPKNLTDVLYPYQCGPWKPTPLYLLFCT